MGQSLSSAQLKTQIQGELGIYYCYPFFNKTATHGDSACCAVKNLNLNQKNQL
jgi:hypothetical protein